MGKPRWRKGVLHIFELDKEKFKGKIVGNEEKK